MIVLGLGSNRGDRLASLRKAVSALGNIVTDIACSSIYESTALLPPGAPAEWDTAFLNMALRCRTSLTPEELLSGVKSIETALGRSKTGYWGPREIDIDILAYGDTVMHEPNLIIPHQHLLARNFALVPFADVAADWPYPVPGDFFGMTASQLATHLTPPLTKTSLAL